MGDHLPAQLLRGDWESAGVESFALATGLAALWARRVVARRKASAKPARRVARAADVEVRS